MTRDDLLLCGKNRLWLLGSLLALSISCAGRSPEFGADAGRPGLTSDGGSPVTKAMDAGTAGGPGVGPTVWRAVYTPALSNLTTDARMGGAYAFYLLVSFIQVGVTVEARETLMRSLVPTLRIHSIEVATGRKGPGISMVVGEVRHYAGQTGDSAA